MCEVFLAGVLVAGVAVGCWVAGKFYRLLLALLRDFWRGGCRGCEGCYFGLTGVVCRGFCRLVPNCGGEVAREFAERASGFVAVRVVVVGGVVGCVGRGGVGVVAAGGAVVARVDGADVAGG